MLLKVIQHDRSVSVSTSYSPDSRHLRQTFVTHYKTIPLSNISQRLSEFGVVKQQ